MMTNPSTTTDPVRPIRLVYGQLQASAHVGTSLRRIELLLLAWGLAVSIIAPALLAEEGRPMDVVPYGQIMKFDDPAKEHGVIWEDPRDVFRVVTVFADGAPLPKPDAIRVQYWQSQWPHRRIPRDQPCGSGSSGWLDIGDWFQGKWRDADTTLEVAGNRYIWTFKPVNAKEFRDLKDFAATYRTTLKLRVVGNAPLPKVKTFEAFTDSRLKPLSFEVEWGGTAEEEQVWDGHLEVFNGTTERVDPLSGNVKLDPNKAWASRVKGKTDGIRATILYAEPKGYNSFDETVVTIRASQQTFSFSATDLIRNGHILLPDFGVLVRKAGAGTTYVAALQAVQKARRNEKTRDIYSRVFDVPEQTLTQAWNDTPLKDPHYIPLSFEGGRQHFMLDEHGNVRCINNWISRIRGKDTDRCRWNGHDIEYFFGLPDSRPVERELTDGCLPIISAAWDRDGVRYRQTATVVPLAGVPSAGARIWGDDTLVLMLRFEMKRTGLADSSARLAIRSVDDTGDEKLNIDGDRIVASAGDSPNVRMLVRSPDPADRYSLTAPQGGGTIAYSALLTTQMPTRTLEVAIPYTTLNDPKEFALLRHLPFEKTVEAVRAYWKARVAAGAQIYTPEPMINDFYKAHVSHLLINTEREAGVSDRYMAKVGTFQYGVFSNESCMMISDLDRRGYHERAEQALETGLHYQGTVGLPGDFSTTDGQFYGAGGYEHGGYNQHHGWVLWCMGEHYWYTRDTSWLNHAAPYLIKGCDWITNERKRTIAEAEKNPIRAIERGLLPPGRLEDIGDWRGWLSTNVYSWWGMQNTAAAMADAGHPDGKRLLADAKAYKNDILAAFGEAMRRSPVIKYRDGSWAPHVPSDVHRRGRSFGWITETLEGAIHLVRCGMLEPHDPISTWIVKDFEDNLYISQQYGYEMRPEQFDRYWFSLGGISQQANLLCTPIPYLLRDEPKHFLRAYFNAFAVSYFPDTRMMTEHALPNIGDWRGDHYKSSDEANSTYWLRMMFIQERDDDLWIGAAIPRYWLADGQKIGIENAATYYGPMSVRLESRVAKNEIEMTIDPPHRNPPRLIRARFRHPEALRITRVDINGTPSHRLDAAKEWVELVPTIGPIRIIARYD